MAQGVGAGLVFGGRYITGSATATNFACIWSEKENATTNDYGGQLHLGTRVNGGNISSDLVIDSLGNVGIGSSAPQHNLQVEGDSLFGLDINLSSRARIVLDDQPFASTTAGSGTIVKWSVSSSSALTAGLLYVLKFDGNWITTDADSEVKSTGLIAIALGNNANLGMLLQGFFYKLAHGFTIGLPLYISNTGGALTTTRPTGTNDYVRIIGYATSVNHIYFDPDKTWVQVA